MSQNPDPRELHLTDVRLEAVRRGRHTPYHIRLAAVELAKSQANGNPTFCGVQTEGTAAATERAFPLADTCKSCLRSLRSWRYGAEIHTPARGATLGSMRRQEVTA